MNPEDLSYQRICWVLGTTTFRTAKLNLTTEEQLVMLRNYRQEILSAGEPWKWKANNALQAQFYDYLTQHGSAQGTANNPAKDARQRTSPLIPLGLATDDRVITDAGHELVELAREGDFDSENIFSIAADSYVYLKQLLKTSLQLTSVTNQPVRPYYVLAHLLDTFGSLTYNEFRYLMPMITDQRSLAIIKEGIRALRSNEKTLEDIILARLKATDGIQDALAVLLEHDATRDIIMSVGLNRKSKQYDAAYYPLYQTLGKVFLNPNPTAADVEELYAATRKLSIGISWRKMLFDGAHPTAIQHEGVAVIPADCPFWQVKDVDSLKRMFFWHMHLYKTMATLEDYADLNRRYFKITDTVIFKDDTVTFDVLPRAFFRVVADTIARDMFTSSTVLQASVDIAQIAPEFDVPHEALLSVLSEEFGVELPTLEVAQQYVHNERYDRLHELLDTRFTHDTLVELLDCFEVRQDERIAELVTDVATPSTIFEYVLGLIWYELSGRSGNVLDYMKLQLEADLLPRTHAAGGRADIVYEYPATSDHPQHALLIEATLSDGTNKRQMEMEPVSRHLGNQIIASGRSEDYCVFVAPRLEMNLVNDFRGRKVSGYFNKQTEEIIPLKIITLTIGQIRTLLVTQRDYATLYPQFQQLYDSPQQVPTRWLDEIAQVIPSQPVAG